MRLRALIAATLLTLLGMAVIPSHAGLIFEWKFDEMSGTTAHDSVGSYNETLQGGAVWHHLANAANGDRHDRQRLEATKPSRRGLLGRQGSDSPRQTDYSGRTPMRTFARSVPRVFSRPISSLFAIFHPGEAPCAR
jgi:hypothetical protein